MTYTNKAPIVPVEEFKRTKIIATVGPSTNDYESIYQLILAGANGLRLNFSHGTPEERLRQIDWIRQASKAFGKPVAIIQDLQGPKIRLGDFEGIINVRAGQNLQFKYKADYARSGIIPIQYDLSKKVKRGERLYIYDGKVHTKVISVTGGVIFARAENDGILIKRKGINLPDTDFSGDIITTKDRKDLVFGSSVGVDYVALSFVQSAKDVTSLRRLLKNLGSHAKIITKIETRSAVENIEAIIQETDVIMIARGDLAIETLPESVPLEQRKIIGLGRRYKKPTIVATQMLASMTETPEPSRAEVSDVATAVIVGADCVMLSDETASGKYPVEAVKVMKRVVKYTEANPVVKAQFPDNADFTRQDAIAKSLINLASEVGAKVIVAETKSGETATCIASFRPEIPIIAVTSDDYVTRQLAIVYGIKSYERPAGQFAATKLTNWLKQKRVLKVGDIVVTASGKYPGVVGTTDTIKVRVL